MQQAHREGRGVGRAAKLASDDSLLFWDFAARNWLRIDHNKLHPATDTPQAHPQRSELLPCPWLAGSLLAFEAGLWKNEAGPLN